MALSTKIWKMQGISVYYDYPLIIGFYHGKLNEEEFPRWRQLLEELIAEGKEWSPITMVHSDFPFPSIAQSKALAKTFEDTQPLMPLNLLHIAGSGIFLSTAKVAVRTVFRYMSLKQQLDLCDDFAELSQKSANYYADKPIAQEQDLSAAAIEKRMRAAATLLDVTELYSDLLA